MTDKDLGIITEGYIKLNDKMGYAQYEATPYLVLEKMIEYYPFNEGDCFIDFGCGLGRVLCFVAKFGCANTIGVEVNETIFKKLYCNVINSGQEGKIKLYNQKAESVSIDSKVNKCFFYNPFYLKYFIKVYYNILRDVKSDIVRIFLYDAAKEYRVFLNTRQEACIEKIIECGKCCSKMWVYKIDILKYRKRKI